MTSQVSRLYAFAAAADSQSARLTELARNLRTEARRIERKEANQLPRSRCKQGGRRR